MREPGAHNGDPNMQGPVRNTKYCGLGVTDTKNLSNFALSETNPPVIFGNNASTNSKQNQSKQIKTLVIVQFGNMIPPWTTKVTIANSRSVRRIKKKFLSIESSLDLKHVRYKTGSRPQDIAVETQYLAVATTRITNIFAWPTG